MSNTNYHRIIGEDIAPVPSVTYTSCPDCARLKALLTDVWKFSEENARLRGIIWEANLYIGTYETENVDILFILNKVQQILNEANKPATAGEGIE